MEACANTACASSCLAAAGIASERIVSELDNPCAAMRRPWGAVRERRRRGLPPPARSANGTKRGTGPRQRALIDRVLDESGHRRVDVLVTVVYPHRIYRQRHIKDSQRISFLVDPIDCDLDRDDFPRSRR